MRLGWIALTTLASFAFPSPGTAQDLVPDVEYFTGKDSLPDKTKGVLMLSAEGVKFTTKDGALIFNIPMASITQVEKSTDIRDASVGKKLLFGNLAGSRKQEFITISTETSSSAEAIVFKLKQNTAAGAVAKINFYRKKAGASTPEDSAASTTKSNPQPPR